MQVMDLPHMPIFISYTCNFIIKAKAECLLIDCLPMHYMNMQVSFLSVQMLYHCKIPILLKYQVYSVKAQICCTQAVKDYMAIQRIHVILCGVLPIVQAFNTQGVINSPALLLIIYDITRHRASIFQQIVAKIQYLHECLLIMVYLQQNIFPIFFSIPFQIETQNYIYIATFLLILNI